MFDCFSISIGDLHAPFTHCHKKEGFGKYANSWDEVEKNANLEAKEAGIVESPLSKLAMEELRKRWSVLEPRWVSDANKLGIDGKSAVLFYRNQLKKIRQD